MPIAELDRIADVRIGATGDVRKRFVRLIGAALGVAADVFAVDLSLPGSTLNLVGMSAIQSVNAMLSAASVKCHLAAPPEDIDVRLDGSGRLVYRCYHSPAHEWDLAGNPRP